MKRTSKKEVEAVFKRFCECNDLPTFEDKPEYPHNGCYFLDHNSVYGGYKISRMCDTGTGESDPFGPTRMSAREFVDCLRFSLNLNYIKEKAGK